MRNWQVNWLPEVDDDFASLDNRQRAQAWKLIRRVATNPLPSFQGGYGKPLGNTASSKLSGLQKIKMRAEGLRIVYKLVERDDVMLIVVVGVRDNDDVYKEAARRREKYDL